MIAPNVIVYEVMNNKISMMITEQRHHGWGSYIVYMTNQLIMLCTK